MSSLRMSNLVFHLTTSIESDLISCLDHPHSHFSTTGPVGPAALEIAQTLTEICAMAVRRRNPAHFLKGVRVLTMTLSHR